MTNGGGAELLPGMGDLPRRPAVEAAKKPAARKTSKADPKKTPAKKGARRPAESLPVARVAVEVSLPHLDRPFDYLVPAELDAAAVPGCRVRVRFAGQLVDGFLLDRIAESAHEGRLAYLERVTSPEAVLTPEIAALAREVADRYAGTLADVLRLAVPPRHARAEARAAQPRAVQPAAGEPSAELATAGQPTAEPVNAEGQQTGRPPAVRPKAEQPQTEQSTAVQSRADAEAAGDAVPAAPGPWAEYPDGPSFLAALAVGRAPRAVWTAMPGDQWPAAIAHAAVATLASGRGVLIVLATGRDVARVEAACNAVRTAPAPGSAGAAAGAEPVVLTADLGPEARYRRWLAVLRGTARVVIGTRAAMFAPVHDLGLVVLWDDGDDVHAEPHAPYPHVREVLALRAHRGAAGALIGGLTRSADATHLVETGWARPLVPFRDRLRAVMPRVRPAGDDTELARDEAARTARLPDLAFRTARRALADGPVLVQVPRRGYLPALACARCREPARCTACQGPLALRSAHAMPYCRWCGHIAGDRRCPECGERRVRAVVTGDRRTAEELGRAFPGVTVRTSGRDGVLTRVPAEPALVVSTPGAEPVAEEGYAAALLLDGWTLLGRPDLRAAEEALRRWANAAALVRPAAPVVVFADGGLPPVQALIRWDPVTHAERELAERHALGFPPAVRMASLTGTPAAIRDLLAAALLPAGAEVLGPVPLADERERALVRTSRSAGPALARALQAAQGARSARRTTDLVRIQLDPLELI